MAWLATVAIVFLVLFFAAVLFGIYVYWKKSTHSREYFAFAVLNAVVFLSIFVLTAIFTQQTPWAAALGIFKEFAGLPHEAADQLGMEQLVLTIIVWGGVLWLSWNFYKHWDGVKSKGQYEREQMGDWDNPLVDVTALLKHFRGIDRLEQYLEVQENQQTMLQGVEENLTWKEQAKELMELVRTDYHFMDWHDEQQCWIGLHQGTKERVVLAVWEEFSDAAWVALREYIERVRVGQQWNQDWVVFAVAVRDGVVDETRKLAGEEVWVVSESGLLDHLAKLETFRDYFRDVKAQLHNDPTLQDTDGSLEDYAVCNFLSL